MDMNQTVGAFGQPDTSSKLEVLYDLAAALRDSARADGWEAAATQACWTRWHDDCAELRRLALSEGDLDILIWG